MNIEIEPSALKGTKIHEHFLRFGLGGLITVMAGLIARRYGPIAGGLFLSFPAIFPAGATLIEKHEQEKKQKIGRSGAQRARDAAALDALGAALGSIGLLAFALVIWRYLPYHRPWITLLLAMLAWVLVSGTLWLLRRKT